MKQTQDSPISLMAIEDQPLVVNRLHRLFQSSPQFQLINIYTQAEQALKDLEHTLPDLLLVDLELPGMQGDELIQILHHKNASTRIAVFTVFEEQSRIIKLMKMGIKGYILKETHDSLLLAELQVIAMGGSTLTERVANKLLLDLETNDNPIGKELSNREYQILNLISLGLTYKDIAEDMDISPHTVRRHIENIYSKLEVGSKIEAMNMAKRMGIL